MFFCESIFCLRWKVVIQRLLFFEFCEFEFAWFWDLKVRNLDFVSSESGFIDFRSMTVFGLICWYYWMLKLNWETGASHKLPGHSTSYPEPSTSYRNIPQANGTFHKRPEQSTSYRKIPRATATFKFCFSKFIFGTRFSNDVFQTLFFKNRCSKHVFSTFVSNTVLKKNRTQFAEIWILVFKMCPWHHDTLEVHVLFFCFDSRFLPRPSAGGGRWPRPASLVKWGR